MIAEDLSKQVVLPPPKFIALLFRTDSSSLYFLIHSLAVNVAYNHRVLVIDGKERVLVSKFIHYPQSILEFFISTFIVVMVKLAVIVFQSDGMSNITTWITKQIFRKCINNISSASN
uniref:Uncharacterized protein n=1 Tax=Cucumis melo TaxID=3656 RepID=A0A9I9EK62_CUCME